MKAEVKGAICGLAYSPTAFAIARTNTLEFFIDGERVFSDENDYMRYVRGEIDRYDANRDFTFTDVSYCCNKFAATTNGYVLFYSLSDSIKRTGRVYVTKHYSGKIVLLKDGFIACNDYCGYFDLNGEIKEDTWFDVPIGRRIRRVRVNGPNLYVATNDAVEVYDLTGERRYLYIGDVFDVDVKGNVIAVATRYSVKLFRTGTLEALGEIEADAYSVKVISENRLLVGGYKKIYELERTERGSWSMREIRANKKIDGIVENVAAILNEDGDEVIIATTMFNWYLIRSRGERKDRTKEEAIPLALPQ